MARADITLRKSLSNGNGAPDRPPYKVVWICEETFHYGHYRPLRVAKFQAGLGADGLLIAFLSRLIGIEQT